MSRNENRPPGGSSRTPEAVAWGKDSGEPNGRFPGTYKITRIPVEEAFWGGSY